ncbi:cytochrome c, partial [Acidobacteria bacterium AH-259-A15]|nr:cytochrome c [Acidobacteria bacterium AH-259-A15]
MTISHREGGGPRHSGNRTPWLATARLIGELRSVLSVTGLCFALLPAGCGFGRRHVRMPDAEPGRTQFENYCAACHQR